MRRDSPRRADIALDLGRSPRPGPDAVDSRQELAGVVTALAIALGALGRDSRVFALTARVAAASKRSMRTIGTPPRAAPGDVNFTLGAACRCRVCLVAGTVEHGRLQGGQSVLVHGAASSSVRW